MLTLSLLFSFSKTSLVLSLWVSMLISGFWPVMHAGRSGHRRETMQRGINDDSLDCRSCLSLQDGRHSRNTNIFIYRKILPWQEFFLTIIYSSFILGTTVAKSMSFSLFFKHSQGIFLLNQLKDIVHTISSTIFE